MTQFSSFVAVEEMIVTDGGQPRRIDVPVEVPEGVNRAAVFGQEDEVTRNLPVNGRAYQQLSTLSSSQRIVTRSGSNSAKTKRPAGGGGGAGGGSSQNSGAVSVAESPAPPPKPASGLFALDGMREADTARLLTQ